MFRAVSYVSVVAFALAANAFDPQLEGFESYSAGDAITSGENNFEYMAAGSVAGDSSQVRAYGGETAKPSARSPKFQDDGENYLELSTDEGILFRNVNADGSAADVTDDGIDIDVTMQFSLALATERCEADLDDKLSIWLEYGNGTTNLVARGGLFTAGGNGIARVQSGSAIYRIDTASAIAPDSWHRVTAKYVANANTDAFPIPGFRISIDGIAVTVTRMLDPGETGSLIFDAAGAAAYATDSTIISEGLADGTYIPSVSDAVTLAKVGFSGEAKVDNIAIVDNHAVPAGLTPGETDGTVYTDAQTAADKAAAVTVAATPEVQAAIEAAGAGSTAGSGSFDIAAYCAMFGGQVVDNGDGSFCVVVALTAAGEAELRNIADDATEDAAAALLALAAPDGTAQDVTVTVKPGFYYSVAYGSDLDNLQEGPRTLADSTSVSLTLPKQSGDIVFYRILVNVVPQTSTGG